MGDNFNIKGNNPNSQFGGINNRQNNYQNLYRNDPELETLKKIIVDFQKTISNNQELLDELSDALTEIHNLKNAQTVKEEKSAKSAIKRIFDKGKEFKDWVGITLLPAEIATKGEVMIGLWEKMVKIVENIV